MSADYSRKSDDTILRIEQKLDNFIQRHEEKMVTIDNEIHDNRDAHQKIYNRLEPLENILKKIEWPARAIGWMIVITVGGSLAFFGTKLGEWIQRHAH